LAMPPDPPLLVSLELEAPLPPSPGVPAPAGSEPPASPAPPEPPEPPEPESPQAIRKETVAATKQRACGLIQRC
jgi:hypothetical protein